MPGWYKVCQIGRSEQQVHLQQFVAFGVQGTLLASVFLLSSLQYQLIGKLLGGSLIPIGELSQN